MPLLGMLGLGGGIARARSSPAATGLSSADYAFSGNNTTTDASGNGASLVHNPGFSTTQKKWGSYSHSFYVNNSGYSRVETPTYSLGANWSIEFWCYATQWAGDYLFTAGPDNDQPNGPAINVQSNEFRTYAGFYTVGQVNYSTDTSNLLNQWNFWQIYRNGNSVRYVLNGTQITNNTGLPTKIVHMVFGNKQSSDTFPITGYFNDIAVYSNTSRGQVSVPTTPFGY